MAATTIFTAATADRLCVVHQPLFDRLFQSRVGGTWVMTDYGRSIAREGRLPTASERARLVTTPRRRRRTRSRYVGTVPRGGDSRRRRRRAPGTSEYEDDNEVDFLAVDVIRAIEVERANNDPLRDTLIFAATNPRLFTVGGERSVATMYRSLWRLIYDSPHFGHMCGCTEENEGGSRTVHTLLGAATFPWRAPGDTLTRFAYNAVSTPDDYYIDLTTPSAAAPEAAVSLEARIAWPTAAPDAAADSRGVETGNIELVRMREHPYDDAFIRRMHTVTSEWCCDVSVAWANDRVHASMPVKLMDYRFESASQAWGLVFDLMDWCERTHRMLGVYPVRRSLWDMLLLPTGGTGTYCGSGSALRVFSGSGLVDVGDVCAYVYSLRILMLIIYLGCSYGGMSRAVSSNERVTNRLHRCVFPKKSSGVYYALFHTSIVPHRLFCYCDLGAATRSATGAASSLDPPPTVEQTRYSERAAALSEANRWLRRFEHLCSSAAERHNQHHRRDHYDDNDDCDTTVLSPEFGEAPCAASPRR